MFLRTKIKRGLSACLLAASTFVFAPFASASDEALTIGYTAALSGNFAGFGESMQRGLELAVQEINEAGGVNGHPIQVETADDRGEPREGVLIAQRFCSNEAIDVVLGYSFSSVALAAIPIIDRCKLPIVASAVTSPDLTGASPYFRRNVLTDAKQGQLAGEYATSVLGAEKIAVLYQQDDYGIGVTEAFRKAAEEAGAEIVAEEAYQLGVDDFRTQLAVARQANPDLIWIGGFYNEAAKIARQARQVGVGAQIFGSDGLLNPELITLGGDAVEGTLLYGMFDPNVNKPEVETFAQAYEEKYEEQPSSWAALAYDAVQTVAAAARNAVEEDGVITRESLHEALTRVEAVPGVTGPTTFDEEGDRDGQVIYLEVADGRFRLAPEQLD